MSKILAGFGGSSHIFTTNAKRHTSIKKFFKSLQKGDNLNKLDELIRKVSFEKIKAL